MKHGHIVVGEINSINRDREFGFISVSGIDDVWFHFSQLKFDTNDIEKGIIVEFKLENSKRGFRAARIKKTTK